MTKKFFFIIILSFVLILSVVFLAQTGRSFTPPTAVWVSEDSQVEANRGFYFVTFKPVSGSPQIIQYAYSSMTRQEFIEFQSERGLLTNADRRRLEGRGTVVQTVFTAAQEASTLLSPIIPRISPLLPRF